MSTNPLVHSFLAGTSKKGVERTARKRFPVLVPWKRKSPAGRIPQVPRTGTSSRTEPKLISSYGVYLQYVLRWHTMRRYYRIQYTELCSIRVICFVEKAIVGHVPYFNKVTSQREANRRTNRILSMVSNWHLDWKLEAYFMIPMNKQYQRRACLCAGKCPVISRDNKPETYAWSINQNPINNPSYTNVSTMVLIRLYWIREVEQQT